MPRALSHGCQRGAAALGVVLMLLAVLALAVGMAHRNLLLEQRASANQLRSMRAFEAAEAGLAWAQAQLNRRTPIGTDCTPERATPGDTDFRARYLELDTATGRFAPRQWAAPGGTRALQAACVATDDGWSCHCPADGDPELDHSGEHGPRPAFHVRFEAQPRAGMIQLVATGCDAAGTACRPGPAGAVTGASSAELQVTLAQLPALAAVPGAALTALGSVDADGALSIVNQDDATDGTTVRAGGPIALPAAQIVTLPGHAAAESLVSHAPALATLDRERLLARLLGIDGARWRALPGVQHIDCSADCAAAVVQADAAAAAPALLWVAGDLLLESPVSIGSIDKPVLLVVAGQFRLHGAVAIHGVVVTLAADWDTSGSGDGALVRGAVVVLGNLRGSGTPAIVRDPSVLGLLHRGAGHFARVAGSWRDF